MINMAPSLEAPNTIRRQAKPKRSSLKEKGTSFIHAKYYCDTCGVC